ncbi:MAG: TPM domain-containing protein [Bdellovibrionia bacterium]
MLLRSGLLKLNQASIRPVALGFIFFSLAQGSGAQGNERIAPSAQGLLKDPAHLLRPAVTQAIQTLLTEHQSLTGESIQIVVHDAVEGEKKDGAAGSEKKERQWVRQTFLDWKPEPLKIQDALLCVIFPASRNTIFEVGYTLELKLDPKKDLKTLGEKMKRALSQGDLNAAALIGSMGVLTALESPLIQNAAANDLFAKLGVEMAWEDLNDLEHAPEGSFFWPISCALGLSLFLFVVYQMLAREAYFSATGWRLIYPWSKERFRYRYHFTPKKEFKGGFTYGSW